MILCKRKRNFFQFLFENAAGYFSAFYDHCQPSAPIAMAIFTSVSHKYSCSLIQNEWKANYQKSLSAYLDRKNIIMNPGMTLRSIEAVKKSVMNGLGIAYVPSFSVQEELKAGSLIQLKTDRDEHLFPGVCVYHKNKWISPQMDLALNVLKKHTGIEYA